MGKALPPATSSAIPPNCIGKRISQQAVSRITENTRYYILCNTGCLATSPTGNWEELPDFLKRKSKTVSICLALFCAMG